MQEVAKLVDDSSKLNTKVIDKIKCSNNPIIVNINGVARIGKSTTLNNMINGPPKDTKEPKKYFSCSGGLDAVTSGCDIFSMIKLKDLAERHGVPTSGSGNEVWNRDIFFIDTEGLKSLKQNTKNLGQAIMTVMQISDISFFATKALNSDDIDEISSTIIMSKILSTDTETTSPKSIIYIMQYTLSSDGTLEEAEKEYEEATKDCMTSISRNISTNKKYQSVQKELSNTSLVLGGQYFPRKLRNPNDDDMHIYWYSLKKLVEKIIDRAKETIDNDKVSGEYVAQKFTSVFEIFKSCTKDIKFDENANIKEFAKNLVTKHFEDKTTSEYCSMINSLDALVKNDFNTFVRISTDNKEAKEYISKKILESKIDAFTNNLYKEFIPEKVESFIESKSSNFQNAVTQCLRNMTNELASRITSSSLAQVIAKPIKDHISHVSYVEDIDFNKINDSTIQSSIINHLMESNQKLLIYFYDKQQNTLVSLILSAIDKVKNIFLLDIERMIDDKQSVLTTQRFLERIARPTLNYINTLQYIEDFDIHKLDAEKILPLMKNDYAMNPETVSYIYSEFSDKYLSLINSSLKLIGEICINHLRKLESLEDIVKNKTYNIFHNLSPVECFRIGTLDSLKSYVYQSLQSSSWNRKHCDIAREIIDKTCQEYGREFEIMCCQGYSQSTCTIA